MQGNAKWIILLVIGGILFLCLACCGILMIAGVAGNDSSDDHGTKIEDTQDEEETSTDDTSEEVATTVKYKIGDRIEIGDYIITVNGTENPYIESKTYSQPDSGNKYIAVEVTYENETKDSISYNVYDWLLSDSDGYTYDQAWGSKEPNLSSGDLNPGEKVRGWVTFEVPETSTQYSIKFTPSIWSSDNAVIELF